MCRIVPSNCVYCELFMLWPKCLILIRRFNREAKFKNEIFLSFLISMLWMSYTSDKSECQTLPLSSDLIFLTIVSQRHCLSLPAAGYIMSAEDYHSLVSSGGKLRRNWAQTILKEARLQCYIRDVFLPLGWDDADDGGLEIGLREERWDAAHTLYLPTEEYAGLLMHIEYPLAPTASL